MTGCWPPCGWACAAVASCCRRPEGTRARDASRGRGTLRAGAFALAARDARIVPGGPRSRLVALRLPLKLSRALRGQRIDVEVGAVSRTGRTQVPQWAGSFDVKR